MSGGSGGNECATGGGTITDSGYNIDDDGTCGFTVSASSVSDSTVIDDYLGSLGNNGGSTQTVPLLVTPHGSPTDPDPALGAVPPSVSLFAAEPGQSGTTVCSVTDQRGVTPTTGANCDIGAYGLAATNSTLVASTLSASLGQSITYTATISPIPDSGTVAFF